MVANFKQRQPIPVIIDVDGIPSHADIIPSLFAAAKAADLEQQTDDAIGSRQTQRQLWVDRLDAMLSAAYAIGADDKPASVVDKPGLPLSRWTVDWALVHSDVVSVSEQFHGGGSRTVTLYIGNNVPLLRIHAAKDVES